MTDSELNRALAELMGYTIYHYDKDYEENCYFMLMDTDFDPVEPDDGRRKTEERAWNDTPDYCTDPAASLEVEQAAIKVSTRYVDTLVEVMKPENMAYSRACVAELLTASPRERAEAAYITLSSKQ
jgi:hypothetical protein